MSLVTELSGENTFLQVGGTSYKCQGNVNVNLQVRTANARGSGDATPRPKAIGLEDGAEVSATVLSTDRALLTLHGTEVTNCDALVGTVTFLGAFTAFVRVVETDDVAGMVTFAVGLVPLTMPSVIDHLDY